MYRSGYALDTPKRRISRRPDRGSRPSFIEESAVVKGSSIVVSRRGLRGSSFAFLRLWTVHMARLGLGLLAVFAAGSVVSAAPAWSAGSASDCDPGNNCTGF